jgi:ABC-type sugar transport system permease subunit
MTNDVKIKAPKKRRKSASLERRKARAGWVFVAPFLIGFIVVYLPMVIDSIRYSFYHRSPKIGGGYDLLPVGWQNYSDALIGPDSTVNAKTFVQILLEGLTDMVFDIPMILIFALFMAVLLNQKMAGRAAFRAIFFVPVIASTGIVATADRMNNLSGYMEGSGGIDDGTGESTATEIVSAMDFEAFFANMAVGQGLVKYVATAVNNIFNIVARSGVQMLIFLAGLQSISPAIYESVQIDGASSWETFWKITFPMISPMILVNAVYTIIDSFTSDSNVVMRFIDSFSNNGKANSDVIASAMSWIYFLIVIGILALITAIISAFVFYQRRD